jgi:hypothetical protein
MTSYLMSLHSGRVLHCRETLTAGDKRTSLLRPPKKRFIESGTARLLFNNKEKHFFDILKFVTIFFVDTQK